MRSIGPEGRGPRGRVSDPGIGPRSVARTNSTEGHGSEKDGQGHAQNGDLPEADAEDSKKEKRCRNYEIPGVQTHDFHLAGVYKRRSARFSSNVGKSATLSRADASIRLTAAESQEL